MLSKTKALEEIRFANQQNKIADLAEANLVGADLARANLVGANLVGANLERAYLAGANLIEANLSNTNGVLSPQKFFRQFERDELGVIVYKRIGMTEFLIPDYWTIEPGEFLTETCNPLPVNGCECGVNFGTIEWCKIHYTSANLWKCRIRWIDLLGVIVPYDTDGKARCNRLELLEMVKKGE